MIHYTTTIVQKLLSNEPIASAFVYSRDVTGKEVCDICSM